MLNHPICNYLLQQPGNKCLLLTPAPFLSPGHRGCASMAAVPSVAPFPGQDSPCTLHTYLSIQPFPLGISQGRGSNPGASLLTILPLLAQIAPHRLSPHDGPRLLRGSSRSLGAVLCEALSCLFFHSSLLCSHLDFEVSG